MAQDRINSVGTMFAGDVISAKLAMAYIIKDGKRIKLFQAKNLKATLQKEKQEVPILGRMQKGNKSVSGKGSGTTTIYHNTPIFDEMALKFMKEGVDTYFDMQITNNDPTSNAGVRTIILKDCNIDKIDIAGFDAEGKYLEQEVPFIFEDLEIPQNFVMLDGMEG